MSGNRYVMLDHINDSLSDARLMVKLHNRPFNPWTGSDYKSTNMEQINRFSDVITQGGIHCTIRRPRGQGIVNVHSIDCN
ncbi:hypothetical protein BDB01DRAFT_770822 [Pilobolus umbonatus]|nr:hypothetical protein BDB01DRAFT_770822 [Pilobolus umbonatus]